MKLGNVALALFVATWASGALSAWCTRGGEAEFGLLFLFQSIASFLGALGCLIVRHEQAPTAYAVNEVELKKLRGEYDAMCERMIAMEERAQRAEARALAAQAQGRKELS